MAATLEQLGAIRAALEGQDAVGQYELLRVLGGVVPEWARIVVRLLEVEMKRRILGGRPRSEKDAKQRSREAQQKYRERKKLANAWNADRAKVAHREKNKKHDKAMQEAGLLPKLKGKGTRNTQRWQTVPKVESDGLHY